MVLFKAWGLLRKLFCIISNSFHQLKRAGKKIPLMHSDFFYLSWAMLFYELQFLIDNTSLQDLCVLLLVVPLFSSFFFFSI